MQTFFATFRIFIAIIPFVAIWSVSENFKLIFFAKPAAYLGALFCGTHFPIAKEGGWALDCFGEKILVNASCSGTLFFAITCCIVFLTLSKTTNAFAKLFFNFFAAALIAYPFTLLANACRIFSASLALSISKPFLTEKYFAALHMGVGFFNFFTFLVILTLIVNFYKNGKPKQRTNA